MPARLRPHARPNPSTPARPSLLKTWRVAAAGGCVLALMSVGVVIVVDTANAASAAYVTTGMLNLRQSPTTKSRILAVLPRGQKITAVAKVAGWLQITYAGKTGYVSASYAKAIVGPPPVVTPTVTPKPSSTPTPSPTPRPAATPSPTISPTLPPKSVVTSVKPTTSPTPTPAPSPTPGPSIKPTRVSSVLAYVRSKVGNAYVWGGAGPTTFDCSGLTMAAYATANVKLPHHAADQIKLGTPVALKDLQPGDLIFWYSPVAHVSLYVGDGMMIHARGTKYGVVLQPVSEYLALAYFAGARRYLPLPS